MSIYNCSYTKISYKIIKPIFINISYNLRYTEPEIYFVDTFFIFLVLRPTRASIIKFPVHGIENRPG